MEELRKAPWPGWETVQLIGRGSFGAVYEIRRELVDGTTESAAMKVITIPQNPEDISEMYGEGYDDESITASFRAHLKSIVAEYTLMRKLDGSANAVNCKDISYVQHPDGIGWDIFIRMELLTPLVKSLSGSTSEETVLKIGRDICSALVLCKKYGIIHRDIKPQNIFVSPNGDYKLGDFGIAKTVEKTMGGTKVGTYKYMAPEVYNNQPYGSGADIYSLGLVLYWLLNERRMPFMPLPPAKVLAGQDEEARQRRLSGEPLPPPAHGSAELKKIVLKACAYAPEARFRSAEEMYEALCRCSRLPASAPAEQQDTPDPSPLAPPPPFFEPTVIDDPPAEPAPAPSAHANDPRQRQQIPVQQGHVQKREEAEKEPPKKKQKKPAGRGIIAIIGILLLGCCALGIYGYMHCWFGHVWQAADCTTGRVCVRCSAVAEEPLGHLWQDATCTTPKTCSRCKATEGKALGHSWETATCTSPKTCSRCKDTEGKALGHSWKAATCTAPKTCSRCGATEGKALEHTWESATCTSPKTCSRCKATEGKALGHSWKAATCTAPKTCSRCGTTEGKALGHSWKAATCTSPKTCSRCKATEGKALGHSWKAATCTSPKTCSRCKATEGKELGHKWKAATYDAPKTCTVCGATTGTALKKAPSAKNQHFDRLALEFVPSKDADVIIAGTANLPELVKAEMAKLGYDIGKVTISVGSNYDATGEAMAAGTIDVGWLPCGTYALYSDDVDVILTATRNGLSNDSTNPADWNGEKNATRKGSSQVPYYRSLIYSTPSEYGKILAEKVNSGKALTWDDLNKANWGVQRTSSSAGYIYPTIWLMKNYGGKTLQDLAHVTILNNYSDAFSSAAAGSVDIIVCYADGRNDYEASWMLPVNRQDTTGKQGLGREKPIWNEMNVIGVTDGIYNDTIAVSKKSAYCTSELINALQSCFINIINTTEGQAIFSVYSHIGYVKAVDSDYDDARTAMALISS